MTTELTKAMRAADVGNESDRAELIATVINTDMVVRQRTTGKGTFTGADVQRLSRIIGEYDLDSIQIAADLKARTIPVRDDFKSARPGTGIFPPAGGDS